jgi:hypothetical protein
MRELHKPIYLKGLGDLLQTKQVIDSGAGDATARLSCSREHGLSAITAPPIGYVSAGAKSG